MSRKVYVVVRQSWAYDDQFFYGGDDPVKAFGDRDQAEAYVWRCEERERRWSLENLGAQVETSFIIVEMDLPA
jgi:hypothetical protein